MDTYNHILVLSNGYIHQVRIKAKSEVFAKVLRVKVKRQIEGMLISGLVQVVNDFVIRVSENTHPRWTYSTSDKGDLE